MSTAFSYPIDHNSQEIRQLCSVQAEIDAALGPFLSKPITPANLRLLGDSLAPSKKKQAAAKAVANSVQDVLKQCDSDAVSVARTCIGGSFGKKTALSSFDLDLVVFLNNAEPPFEKEISFFSKFLPQRLNGLKFLKSSPFSVTFLLGGFKVDLLPAPNFVSGSSPTPGDAQREALLNEIEKASNDQERNLKARFLSPAFSESIVSFMAKQQPFVNAAVRLGKLWKKSCCTTNFTFPRWFSSFLVELIMCHVATRELSEQSEASLLRVFNGFLELLSEPQKLCIIFTDIYSQSAVPDKLRHERPLVVDPANPYLNVAKQMTWEPVRLLALDTLVVLNRAVERPTTIHDLFQHRLGNDIPQLFQRCKFNMKFVSSKSWLRTLQVRDIADLHGKQMDQGVVWRATEKLERSPTAREAKPTLLAMFDDLIAVTNMALSFNVTSALTLGKAEIPVVADFMDGMMQEVFDDRVTNWCTTTRTNEDCDVTLIFGQVPVRSHPDNLRYVYISLSFDVDDHRFDYLCHEIASSIRRRASDDE